MNIPKIILYESGVLRTPCRGEMESISKVYAGGRTGTRLATAVGNSRTGLQGQELFAREEKFIYQPRRPACRIG